MKISEITFSQFSFRNMVSSYTVFGSWYPAIFKREQGYGIRIRTGLIQRNGSQSDSYDYFELDESGLIIKSPRGYARRFNKQIRIKDIAETAEKCKEWRIRD